MTRQGWPSSMPPGASKVRREAGKLSIWRDWLNRNRCRLHWRQATRAGPRTATSQRNAHPHSSPDGDLVVVQNGIVENFLDLRRSLQADGYEFRSDTDTEVIVHLIHPTITNGCAGELEQAVRAALHDLQGPSAIVMLSQRQPDRLIAARLGNAGGVAIRLWRRARCSLPSDIPAILRHNAAAGFPGKPPDGCRHGGRRGVQRSRRPAAAQRGLPHRLESHGRRKRRLPPFHAEGRSSSRGAA